MDNFIGYIIICICIYPDIHLRIYTSGFILCIILLNQFTNKSIKTFLYALLICCVFLSSSTGTFLGDEDEANLKSVLQWKISELVEKKPHTDFHATGITKIMKCTEDGENMIGLLNSNNSSLAHSNLSAEALLILFLAYI